jgi:hypothetical protein
MFRSNGCTVQLCSAGYSTHRRPELDTGLGYFCDGASNQGGFLAETQAKPRIKCGETADGEAAANTSVVHG